MFCPVPLPRPPSLPFCQHARQVCSSSACDESPFPTGCHLAVSRRDWRISEKEGGQSVFLNDPYSILLLSLSFG